MRRRTIQGPDTDEILRSQPTPPPCVLRSTNLSTPNAGQIHTLCPAATRACSEAGILFQFQVVRCWGCTISPHPAQPPPPLVLAPRSVPFGRALQSTDLCFLLPCAEAAESPGTRSRVGSMWRHRSRLALAPSAKPRSWVRAHASSVLVLAAVMQTVTTCGAAPGLSPRRGIGIRGGLTAAELAAHSAMEGRFAAQPVACSQNPCLAKAATQSHSGLLSGRNLRNNCFAQPGPCFGHAFSRRSR